MGIGDYLRGVWRTVRGTSETLNQNRRLGKWNTEKERYETLRAYRGDDDLYARLRGAVEMSGYAGYKSIRNPAHALSELYASKLTEKTEESLEAPEELKTLASEILKKSNWSDRSEVAARDYAVTGDLYLKAANTEARAFFQWIDPAHVTECDEDDRGHVTFYRSDIPQSRRDEDGEVEDYTETEVYDKARGYHAVYHHDDGASVSLRDLAERSGAGRRGVTLVIYEELAETPLGEGEYTGFDFIPIVHRKLRDTGASRGEGAYQHALSDIDETNQIATRFHDLLFPEIAWVLTRGYGQGGEELPPIVLQDEAPEDRKLRIDQEKERVVKVGSQRMFRLPSGADMKPLIPAVKLEAHLDALAKQVRYVEESVLPELQYRSLKEQGQLSGRAARIYLSDSIDRLGSARRKYDDGIVRVIQMCLTLGALAGLPQYEGVPAYSEREDEISISERDVFPISEVERLEGDAKEVDILAAYNELGMLKFRLEDEGVDEDRIQEILRAAANSSASPTFTSLFAPTLGADMETEPPIEEQQ